MRSVQVDLYRDDSGRRRQILIITSSRVAVPASSSSSLWDTAFIVVHPYPGNSSIDWVAAIDSDARARRIGTGVVTYMQLPRATLI